MIVITLVALSPTASASAQGASLRMLLPGSPPTEQAAFPIIFVGDVTSLRDGQGNLTANVRPAGGPPCAATADADRGYPVDFGGGNSTRLVGGDFVVRGSFAADRSGDYLICAWLKDTYGQAGPPPASASITVRRALFAVTATAPPSVHRGVPFVLTLNYDAEVPRHLTVFFTEEPDCSVATTVPRSLGFDIVVEHEKLSGAGTLSREALLDFEGAYRLCAFFEGPDAGGPLAYLVQAAAITVVVPPLQRCGNVGGPRHIKSIRSRGLPCREAKMLARRWGSRRRPPRYIGSYGCGARSGSVTCTAESAEVTFRFGRRSGAPTRTARR